MRRFLAFFRAQPLDVYSAFSWMIPRRLAACHDFGVWHTWKGASLKIKISKSGVLVAPVIDYLSWALENLYRYNNSRRRFMIFGVEGSERMYNRKDHLTS